MAAVRPVARTSRRGARRRPDLDPARVAKAFERLSRQRAFQTLVRGALPAPLVRTLLKDAMPARVAREMPAEVWSCMAASIALDAPAFGLPLAQELHDRLAWDREPAELEAWWTLVRDKPLEALWMAALSEDRSVGKEFAHIAQHCLENFRSSPDCPPPSWDYVEGLIDVQARTAEQLKESEREAEGAERRYQVERSRVEELREELKRLRRENSELRAARAGAERRAEALETRTRDAALGRDADELRRAQELERKLRKAEKEREHLRRELERLAPEDLEDAEDEAWSAALELAPAAAGAPRSAEPALSQDPNPRRRLLRQTLRKLFKKGKIGASHTHEDNVFRGVADHEKGIAKELMDLLYREGLLMPKPTTADPHVSLAAERLNEIKAIIAGEIGNPRLRRFVGA
jgi:hypothetical protein